MSDQNFVEDIVSQNACYGLSESQEPAGPVKT
jgi:hypothetical protein